MKAVVKCSAYMCIRVEQIILYKEKNLPYVNVCVSLCIFTPKSNEQSVAMATGISWLFSCTFEVARVTPIQIPFNLVKSNGRCEHPQWIHWICRLLVIVFAPFHVIMNRIMFKLISSIASPFVEQTMFLRFILNVMIYLLVQHFRNTIAYHISKCSCFTRHYSIVLRIKWYDSVWMGFILARAWYLIFSFNLHPVFECQI